ncbi:MAG TPA: DUF2442 domain-containing protein [Paludibacter sp.]
MIIDIKRVWVDDVSIYIETRQGQIRSLAIADFRLLRNATPEQLQNFEVGKFGIHWENLDEDLSFDGFFKENPEEVAPEIASIFNSFPEINLSAIAKRVGINQSLMAKYKCGILKPSPKRLKEIESALHELGSELLAVHL